MEIDCNATKRKPISLDWDIVLPLDSSDDDQLPELVVKSEHEITENQKADKGCEETIQLSDRSEDGGKEKSASKFARFFYKKMEEDPKDSRIVDAFEKDLPSINPCQGRKLTKSQILAMRRSKMGSFSSQTPKTSTTSFSEPNSPQDPPSRNLRPRPGRAYHLVDVEPVKLNFMGNLDPCLKDVKVYYPSRCLRHVYLRQAGIRLWGLRRWLVYFGVKVGQN